MLCEKGFLLWFQELRAVGQPWAAVLDLRAQNRQLKPEIVQGLELTRWATRLRGFGLSGDVCS